MSEIALALVPLMVLLASLLAGHYPGLETIVKLVERMTGWPCPRAERQAHPKAPLLPAVGGGLLIACGLATRPPPALLPR